MRLGAAQLAHIRPRILLCTVLSRRELLASLSGLVVSVWAE